MLLSSQSSCQPGLLFLTLFQSCAGGEIASKVSITCLWCWRKCKYVLNRCCTIPEMLRKFKYFKLMCIPLHTLNMELTSSILSIKAVHYRYHMSSISPVSFHCRACFRFWKYFAKLAPTVTYLHTLAVNKSTSFCVIKGHPCPIGRV